MQAISAENAPQSADVIASVGWFEDREEALTHFDTLFV